MSFQRHRGTACWCLICFAFILHWRGLSTLPSRSYSLPSSSRLRAHTWSLLFVVGSIFTSFSFLLLLEVPIIFQAAVGRMLGRACIGEQRRVSLSAKSVHKSPRQGLSAFHYPPSTFTGLSAWPIYLIISLENCSVLLFCCPPACEYMACVYLRFSGGFVHLRGIELVTADFKKINHSQV